MPGATARGSGLVLSASGLTSGDGGRATILYDLDAAKVSAQGEQAGELTVTRGARHVASHGATELAMTRGGTTTAKALGGPVSLVLSSAGGANLASATLVLPAARNSVVQVRGRLAEQAIRHGGRIAVGVRRGRQRSLIRVPIQSAASRYRLGAHVHVRGRGVKVGLSALRRLPRGAEAWVLWRVTRGKKTLLRRRIEVRRPRVHRGLARIRLPEHLRGATVKAVVHVVVTRPAPVEMIAADSHRIRHRKRHRGHKHHG